MISRPLRRTKNISETGSREFLKLAIEQLAKTQYQLDLTKVGFIRGVKSKIDALINEIETWEEDEFDLEDFEVIGYCKNIRWVFLIICNFDSSQKSKKFLKFSFLMEKMNKKNEKEDAPFKV